MVGIPLQICHSNIGPQCCYRGLAPGATHRGSALSHTRGHHKGADTYSGSLRGQAGCPHSIHCSGRARLHMGLKN